MSEVAQRLLSAGWELPPPPSAVGRYVPATRAGSLVFTSGQLPFVNGSLLSSGSVGATVSEDVAFLCARQAALNALAAAATVCDLDRVCAVLKLVGYVNSSSGFSRQPAVIDGASEVLLTAFAGVGHHAREAVGVLSLPLDAPVELSVILSVVDKT